MQQVKPHRSIINANTKKKISLLDFFLFFFYEQRKNGIKKWISVR